LVFLVELRREDLLGGDVFEGGLEEVERNFVGVADPGESFRGCWEFSGKVGTERLAGLVYGFWEDLE
jgi:hypothetical protein